MYNQTQLIVLSPISSVCLLANINAYMCGFNNKTRYIDRIANWEVFRVILYIRSDCVQAGRGRTQITPAPILCVPI